MHNSVVLLQRRSGWWYVRYPCPTHRHWRSAVIIVGIPWTLCIDLHILAQTTAMRHLETILCKSIISMAPVK
ncbi:hypothetical protein AHF37_06842 [Paragonimus kellicotti]|nr:hypothetical protein AHF37_06842 [Paragonimus kellicotti]